MKNITEELSASVNLLPLVSCCCYNITTNLATSNNKNVFSYGSVNQKLTQDSRSWNESVGRAPGEGPILCSLGLSVELSTLQLSDRGPHFHTGCQLMVDPRFWRPFVCIPWFIHPPPPPHTHTVSKVSNGGGLVGLMLPSVLLLQSHLSDAVGEDSPLLRTHGIRLGPAR